MRQADGPTGCKPKGLQRSCIRSGIIAAALEEGGLGGLWVGSGSTADMPLKDKPVTWVLSEIELLRLRAGNGATARERPKRGRGRRRSHSILVGCGYRVARFGPPASHAARLLPKSPSRIGMERRPDYLGLVSRFTPLRPARKRSGGFFGGFSRMPQVPGMRR